MTDNSIKTNDGSEIYLHEIQSYADQYVEEELNGNTEEVQKKFIDMIYFIKDRIEKPDNNDIELLDSIFNIYTRLCSKYSVLPTLEVFSMLVGIDRNTFTDWAKGEYRRTSAHGSTAKKWKDTCKAHLIHALSNERGADANKIFIAKAAYGMQETSPIQPDSARLVDKVPDLPSLALKYGVDLDDSEEQPDEPPTPEF